MPDQKPQSGLLVFAVGPVYCVAETVDVAAVIPPAPLSHLPGDHDSPGFFRHGGLLVRLIDLRARFGLPERQDARRRVIVVHLSEGALGYLVDHVDNVVDRNSGRFGPTPRYVPRQAFPGTFTLGERLHLYVDLSRLWQLQSAHWLRESGLYPSIDEPPVLQQEGMEAATRNAPKTEKPAVPPDDRPQTGATGATAVMTETGAAPREDAPGPRPATNARPDRKTAATTRNESSTGRPKPAKGMAASAGVGRPPTNQASPPTRIKRSSPAQPEAGRDPVRRQASDAGPGHVKIQREPSGPAAMRADRREIAPAPAQVVEDGDESSPWVTLLMVLGLLMLAGIGVGLLLFDPSGDQPSATRPEPLSGAATSREARASPPEAVGVVPAAESPSVRDTPSAAAPVQPPMSLLGEGEDASSGVAVETPVGLEEDVGDGGEAASPLTREGSLVTLILEEPPEGDADTVEEKAAPLPESRLGAPTSPDSGQDNMSAAPEAVSVEPRLHEGREIKREIVHVVERGDTLWAIARQYLDDPYRYPELARLSGIRDPDLIYPGDRVRILILGRPDSP